MWRNANNLGRGCIAGSYTQLACLKEARHVHSGRRLSIHLIRVFLRSSRAASLGWYSYHAGLGGLETQLICDEKS